jgi:hypothetical protein
MFSPQWLTRLRAMSDSPIRRRIEFDTELWHALNHLSRDSGIQIHELADEAFRDLLKKHRRPITLRDALRESVRMQPANDHPREKHRITGRR